MIGIFGGTFDPIHNGHLRSALEVKEQFGLQEIRLVPCALPAHRQQPWVDGEKRLQMLKLALANRPGMQVDARELQRTGPSYMVDTLQSIRDELIDFATPLLLFIGMDAFKLLTSWHQWQNLFKLAHIVVLTRPGTDKIDLTVFFSGRMASSMICLKNQPGGKLFFHKVTQLDISATQIRNIIAENRKPDFLLPDEVIEYINQNKLYQKGSGS